MKRQNKYRIEYIVQSNYGYGHGWEDETAEDTYREARQRLREYRENSPGAHRLIKRRVLNEQEAVDRQFNLPVSVYSAVRGPL